MGNAGLSKHIDAETLRSWQTDGRDFVLVDTLPPAAFAKGHLPGALHIMSDDILRLAMTMLPDRQQMIVVYCASINCKRAGLAAARLERLGYANVTHFAGGKREWLAAGLPLETYGDADAG